MSGGYEIGVSQSDSFAQKLASQLGGGNVNVYGGGAKQAQTFMIVAGVVAVAAVLLVLVFKRRW